MKNATLESTMPTKEEVMTYVYSRLGGNSVRGETIGQPITPQTPCHDCFHADVDGIDIQIGKPIGRQFGIGEMGTDYGIPHHSYHNLGEHKETFYEKYPIEDLSTEKFTLERFAEMMYDLVRIKHDLAPE